MAQEADPNLEATRRYFGKLVNGGLYYRGIELRRHDFPSFLKRFKKRVLEILFDTECAEDVETGQFKKACDYVVEACDRIAGGEIELEKLVVSKLLRKPVTEYKSLFPHVVAAIQMMQKGKKLKSREKIDFLYVNVANRNPFRRVIPASALGNDQHYYDREKYLEMALDVAATVLGVFGFDRRQLGFRPTSKDFLTGVLREREEETLLELQSLYSGKDSQQ